MKKFLSAIWPIVIFLGIVIAGIWAWRGFYQENNNQSSQENNHQINNGLENNNSEDKNDFDELDIDAIGQAIKQVLSEKYNRDLSLFQFQIGRAADNHIRGDVVFFDDSGQPIAGAIVLAAKAEGEWQIVFDGNGQIDCALAETYGFPEEMISDCASVDQGEDQSEIISVCVDNCGNGICEEIVCMAVGCPCAETAESCPEDCE